jgi:hypothetical protein
VSEWAKVVSDPLGLAGFALFLVFSLLAGLKRSDERRWIAKAAIFMAFAALVCGLGLACLRVLRPIPAATKSQTPAPIPKQNCGETDQKSAGPGSPNVNCVQGNVTITVDQSSGGTGAKSNSGNRKTEGGK